MLKVLNLIPSFSVTDTATAKRFYGQTLGFEVSEQNEMMGILDIVGPGGVHVTAYPKADHQPATFTIMNLLVPNVDAAVDELAANGISMEHYDMPDLRTDAKGVARGRGPDIAWFKDPFGNILSVIEAPPSA